jgi:putative intracellular protease/amidase
MVVRDRSFSRGSPVCDYWLSRCEGFVVRAGGRTVGIVEAVEATDPLGRAEELLVRRRRSRVLVPAEQVLAVVPGRKELLARRRSRPLGPRLRAAYAAAKPVVVALAGAVALFARALAVRLVRDAVALVRGAGDEIPRLERHVAAVARRVDQLRPPGAPEPFEVRRAEPDDANAYGFALRSDPRDEQP